MFILGGALGFTAAMLFAAAYHRFHYGSWDWLYGDLVAIGVALILSWWLAIVAFGLPLWVMTFTIPTLAFHIGFDWLNRSVFQQEVVNLKR